jgi:hypothetical protein
MTVETFWEVVLGLVTVLVFGLKVKPLVDQAKVIAPLIPPNDATKDKWASLTEGDEGGSVLGPLERILYFGALWIDAPELIATWLAFKVASKWNVWINVIAVPKTLPNVDDLDLLIARRRWGSNVLMTFLIGTASNLVVGFAGVAIGRYGLAFLRDVLC